jgi:ATP-binding cassette subfamily B protein
MDCGPTCIRMIARHYGRTFAMDELRRKSYITKEGVNLLGISDAAEAIGFRTLGVKISFDKLKGDAQLPCIAHWNQRHFVVVYDINNSNVKVADPAIGLLTYSVADFQRCWLATESNGQSVGIALMLEATPRFYEVDAEADVNEVTGFRYILSYLRSYRKYVFQIGLSMLLVMLIQFVFPFLTQSIVDVGISTKNVSFIYLVLAAHLMLFFSRTVVEFFRRWIMLHLSTRINLSIISDFLVKLMKLPISFFDSKNVGDILQRINDHSRVEAFISSSSLNLIFALFNLIIFGVVLATYHIPIFFVFSAASVIYVLFVLIHENAPRVRLQAIYCDVKEPVIAHTID